MAQGENLYGPPPMPTHEGEDYDEYGKRVHQEVEARKAAAERLGSGVISGTVEISSFNQAGVSSDESNGADNGGGESGGDSGDAGDAGDAGSAADTESV